MVGIDKKKRKRAVIILVSLILVFALLSVKILYIQTFQYNKYLKKVNEQILTESKVKANRGLILDKNGNVLATSKTTYRVFVSPSAIQSKMSADKKNGISKDYKEIIANGLCDILNIDKETIKKQTEYSKYLDRTIKKNVDKETADKVRIFIEANDISDLLFVEATSERYYPYDTLCATVLGFTDADGEGLYGLENTYNEYLKGKDGYYVTARDSFGNELKSSIESYIEAEDGNTLNTTIDIYLQKTLEEQLMLALSDSDAKNRASGIIMNVKTGAILAMATVPSYDANNPRELNEYYLEMLNDEGLKEGSSAYEEQYAKYVLEMWRNKSVSDSYIPGSTFKIITSAMAMSEGLIDLNNDTVFCGGSKIVADRTIHCHKRKGHGSLTFAEGLQQSCNVWFMTLGQRIGIKTYYEYFLKFGYLEKTGIDLPGEATSIIKKEADMKELDLSIYAFGQNFNVTPIQHITAIATVANGGYSITPHIVESVVDKNGNTIYQFEETKNTQVIDSEVSKTISKILKDGVEGEGGAKNAYVEGYSISAKTGTSEKKGNDINVEGVKAYVCSCVGYAPSEDPEIAVLIMVDEPSEGILYGSVVAAPYLSEIFEVALPYLDIEKNTEETATEKVPDLVGLKVDNAKLLAESYGYSVNIIGEGTMVQSQMPSADTEINKDTKTITLYLDNAETKTVKVPNLIGKTPYEANIILTNLGLNIEIDGIDNKKSETPPKVVSQYPESNTDVPISSIVKIKFRYLDVEE